MNSLNSGTDLFDLMCQADKIEFFYNSLFSAKSWQNPASIDRQEQNKSCPSGDWTQDLLIIMPTLYWLS